MLDRGTGRRAAARRGVSIFAELRAGLGVDAFSFRDKVVLVTGGSRGLGLALARRLGAMGAKVAIVARDKRALERARDDLRGRGHTVIAVECDVRERLDVQSAVRTIGQELGPIDVLINNAGILQVGPMEHMTPEDFDDAMKTHFWGSLHTTQAVLPGMRRRGEGRIVNISSIGGVLASPHLLPYSASKFAQTGLSEAMRTELLAENITVTTVTPGLMRTGSLYNAFFKGRHRDELTWFMLAGSLPLVSISAERAAKLVLRATRAGRSRVVLGLVAKLGVHAYGLFPGLATALASLVNRLLPAPGGIGARRARGRDSQTRLSSSFLTVLTQRAALEYNQLSPGGQPEVSPSPESPTGTTRPPAGAPGGP